MNDQRQEAGTPPGIAGRPRKISVIVPVTEHPHPLGELYAEFSAPLRQAGFTFEFLFVFEPIYANLVPPLLELIDRGEPVRVLEMTHVAGETTLLRAAAERADYDVLVTLPAYPRIVAEDLPGVIEPVLAGADMAVARRWPRRDSWLNQLQNRVFHAMVSSAAGQGFRDMACGVRAVDRDVFGSLPLYGTFHRFLPLLARRGGHTVVEVEATQHQDDQQPRVYSPRLYMRRILDVFGLYFLLRFTEKPLRFFGQVGAFSCVLGGLITVVLIAQRFAGRPMADRPMLLVGALMIVLGVQAIALGLVGEMIVHLHAPQRRSYQLKHDDEESV